MVKSATHRITDNIPGDQEIRGKTQPVNDLQFMAHTLQGIPVIAVTVFPAVKGKFFKQYLVVIPAPGKSLLILDRTIFKADTPLIKNLPGILKQFRKVGIPFGQLRFRKEMLVTRGQHGTGKFTQ